MGVGSEHEAFDIGLPGLFLCKRVGSPLHAECPLSSGGVGSTKVVALPSSSVIKDAVVAVPLGYRTQTLGDPSDCRIPVDFYVGAIVEAPHRRCQSTVIVLVVVDTQGLFACVAR